MSAFRPSAFRCALLVACFVLLTPGMVAAQNSAPSAAIAVPAFEVATIKPTDPERTESSIGLNQGGSFQARGITLRELIQFAYDLGYFAVDQRIVGGPKWVGSARFDLDAKCDDKTAGEFRKVGMKQQLTAEQGMMRALLAERFKLSLHHESRMMPVLELLATHAGPKLRPSEAADTGDLLGPDGPPGNWKAKGVTMEELAANLSQLTDVDGRIVVDKTGFGGKFDFSLKWTPDTAPGAPPDGSDNGIKPDATAPLLITALEEQLGLKLEPSRQPVDVLVIDAAEMPSAN